jgi:DNA repair protein REV1
MLSFGKKRGREEEHEVSPVPVEKTEQVDSEDIRTPQHDVRSRTHVMSTSPEPEVIIPANVPKPNNQRVADIIQSPADALAAGTSRAMASSDGIDADFLAALPDDLRQEVKRDHAIAKARSRANSEKPPNTPTITTDRERERAATISPAKAKGIHAAAHITKQLRPKVKTQLKASAIAKLPLYGAWNKANTGDDDVVDLSADGDDGMEKIGVYYIKDLKELGIDPAFLRDLPEDMQKEVVDQEMTRKNKRTMLHRPADTSRIRAQEKERARTSVSVSRSSRAGSAPIAPVIVGPTVLRPTKPKLFNATTLPEVIDVVAKWIDSRKGSGPAVKDAKKVEAYLVKCMRPEYGLGGTELAVEVLKFMRVAVDERWEEEACEDDLVGSEWWSTWRGFRDTVDQLCKDRFGAGLRL